MLFSIFKSDKEKILRKASKNWDYWDRKVREYNELADNAVQKRHECGDIMDNYYKSGRR